jgi:hypothetical protein
MNVCITTCIFSVWVVLLNVHGEAVISYNHSKPLVYSLTHDNIQGVPRGKVSILECHSISRSKQKSINVHVFYFEWFQNC